jgi:predicted HTH domain antitoxin
MSVRLSEGASLLDLIIDQMKAIGISSVIMQEAATAAKVTIYEMMEHVESEQIRPPEDSREEMEADLERTKRIMANRNMKQEGGNASRSFTELGATFRNMNHD